LSDKQEQQRKRDEAWINGIFLVLALLAGVSGMLLLLPFVRSGQLPKGDETTKLVFGILFAFISVWFFRGVIFSTPDNTVVKAQGELKLAKSVRRSGNVSDQESTRTNIVNHEMVVGGHT
jgi:hypothetical protein